MLYAEQQPAASIAGMGGAMAMGGAAGGWGSGGAGTTAMFAVAGESPVRTSSDELNNFGGLGNLDGMDADGGGFRSDY